MAFTSLLALLTASAWLLRVVATTDRFSLRLVPVVADSLGLAVRALAWATLGTVVLTVLAIAWRAGGTAVRRDERGERIDLRSGP